MRIIFLDHSSEWSFHLSTCCTEQKLELTTSQNPFQPSLSYPTISSFCTNRSVRIPPGFPGYSSPICSPSLSTERLPSAPFSQCGNLDCLLFKCFSSLCSHYFTYFPDIWKEVASKQAQCHLFLLLNFKLLAARCTKFLTNIQTKQQPLQKPLSLCSCIYS